MVRGELIEVGIGPGRVNGLIGEMQRECIRLCGGLFARVLGGAERTDAETAERIVKAKHVPSAPAVEMATGWCPQGQSWKDYVLRLSGWLGVIDEPLSTSVKEIFADYEVDHAALLVQRGQLQIWPWALC